MESARISPRSPTTLFTSVVKSTLLDHLSSRTRTSPFCVALMLKTFEPVASEFTSLRSYPLISTGYIIFFNFFWAGVCQEYVDLFTGTAFLKGHFIKSLIVILTFFCMLQSYQSIRSMLHAFSRCKSAISSQALSSSLTA